MTWSGLFMPSTAAAVFTLIGVVSGVIALLVLLLQIVEFVSTKISKYMLGGIDDLFYRFFARFVLFWVTKLLDMFLIIVSIIVVSITDSPSAGNFIQAGFSSAITLFGTWSAVTLSHDFERHLHIFSIFQDIKNARWLSHVDRHDTKPLVVGDKWELIDADMNKMKFKVLYEGMQKAVKEVFPLTRFTTERFSTKFRE